MALFNKFFSTHKNTHSKHQDNVSDKLFAFSTEQVRIVLFRECDFRGRKLLFDSDAIKKIPVDKADDSEKFAEISNGYGYLYTKPNSDYSQLSEMVFGSVAMSFRGTYFKIHSLSSPTRLMFTQVFPSPHSTRRKRVSVSSRHSRTSNLSIEHSITLDDSGASSVNSMSEQLSDRSTASDTVLVCRRLNSFPLDVPSTSPASNPSIIVDSGFTEHSFVSSVSAESSFPTWESVISGMSTLSFSSSNLFKRLLRSTSRSLEHSCSSPMGSNSTEECYASRPHHRPSKLGLAVVLEIPSEKKENLIQFFMEHIALLESMIWRARQAIEIAYYRPHVFISSLKEIAQISAQWLVSLLSGPRIVLNHWQTLSNSCDNVNSISAFNSVFGDNTDISRTTSSGDLQIRKDKNGKGGLSNSFNGFSFTNSDKSDFLFFNISRFLKTDWDNSNIKKSVVCGHNIVTEKFLKEFCEILEAVDVKNTNFFMSTLLTAVLTHHLGWVATCFPSSSVDSEAFYNRKGPYNALWDQLTDLYGAIGHPIKTAQTIVTGNNKNDIIFKIINSLTYFIRYSNMSRRSVERGDIEKENRRVEMICHQSRCIPKENYKKYEDHLREMLCNSNCGDPTSGPKLNENNEKALKEPKLVKHKSHTLNLSQLAENNEVEGDKQFSEKAVSMNSDEIHRKVFKLFRTPDGAVTTEKKLEKVSSMMDLNKFHEKVHMEKQTSCYDFKNNSHLGDNQSDCDSTKNSSVVFVLGDDEQLVGLKKGNSKSNLKVIDENNEKHISYQSTKPLDKPLRKRPSTLCLPKTAEKFTFPSKESSSKAADSFVCEKTHSQLHSSLSLESLYTASEQIPKHYSKDSPDSESEATCSKPEKIITRSQSEPPEDRSPEYKGRKSKYRYSRVKFNLLQYPQVVTNYMKTKNLELGTIPLGGKALKFGELSNASSSMKIDFSEYDSDSEEVEALQTPSNASELEFTSDLNMDLPKAPKNSTMAGKSCLKKGIVPSSDKLVTRKISAGDNVNPCMSRKMKSVNIPMPITNTVDDIDHSVHYTSSLMKGLVDSYIPDMVLQGTTHPKSEWDSKLKNNLSLMTQHSLLDQPVEESVAIVANTDSWEVQIVSSHTYIIDKGSTGIRVGMSQLVANMLDSLLQMWKLHIPPQYCIMHIEQRLQELCIRSKALAQLLLTTEFCSMELLTSTLHLEVNDVPLLMAVASTHTPQVTQKYGLSFQ